MLILFMDLIKLFRYLFRVERTVANGICFSYDMIGDTIENY